MKHYVTGLIMLVLGSTASAKEIELIGHGEDPVKENAEKNAISDGVKVCRVKKKGIVRMPEPAICQSVWEKGVLSVNPHFESSCIVYCRISDVQAAAKSDSDVKRVDNTLPSSNRPNAAGQDNPTNKTLPAQ